ncbi:MAG: hypothetical protein U0R69_12320 [Gaiellales bacterium]
MPICSDTLEAGFAEVLLDEVLRVLDEVGAGECLVCGELVDVGRGGHVHCAVCGSVLEAPARPGGQLAMV